jgi:hypothetical protein
MKRGDEEGDDYVLDEREYGMALITTPAKTVLILLIRVPSISYYSAKLRTVNN